MFQTYDASGNPIQSVPLGYTLGSITYILNGTTTYSVPAGCRAIVVRAISGGGAGGSVSTAASSAAAGGGQGGTYAQKLIVTPAASYAVSVAAGGAAGATGNNPGGNGADTVFGASLAVAKGASGGLADTGTTTLHFGGLGGGSGAVTGNVGDLKMDGEPGGTGMTLTTASALSGWGGMAAYGFGAGGQSKKNATGAGGAGALYGGGGSGATLISSGASQAGGAGGNGLMIVEEYF